MKKLLQFAPTYIVLFLIIGIVVGNDSSIEPFYIFFLLLAGVALLFFFYIQLKFRNHLSIYFSLLIYALSFTFGLACITFSNELNSKNHYAHFIDSKTVANPVKNQVYVVKIQVLETLKPILHQQKYVAKVVAVNNHKSIGKVLLNVKNDTLKYELNVDDRLLIYTSFNPIEPPKNPFYFNYKSYLKNQQIHHQLTISDNEFELLKPTTTIFGLAAELRTTINQKLEVYNIDKEALAVLNALLLGQRQDISKDLMLSYTNAGAVHILAVSGLHIGIILLILNFIFKPLERIKNGRFLKMFLLVLLLWIYAIIAGLSASVIRAVLMFSILAVGINLNRTTNIYFTLVVSLLVLLLVNPYYLFDVGFQLSYAAVFSIVIFQPIFQSYWYSKNRIVQFYWNLITVSVAAQLGVLPISLYYFHQFPGLFILANLLIIPFLGIILIGGIIVFGLALSNVLPMVLAKSYFQLIELMNGVIHWISAQESYLITEISFDKWMLTTLFIVIISTAFYLKQLHPHFLKMLLLAIIGFQLVLVMTKWKTENTDEIVIFHKNKHSIIGKKIGSQIVFFTNLDTTALNKEQFIKSYRIGSSIQGSTIQPSKNIFSFHNKIVLVVDESGIYNVNKLKPEIVILRNSPKINLERMIDYLNPKLVIADGSNYSSYANLWKATCLKRKTPFHHTGQKGAYILK